MQLWMGWVAPLGVGYMHLQSMPDGACAVQAHLQGVVQGAEWPTDSGVAGTVIL